MSLPIRFVSNLSTRATKATIAGVAAFLLLLAMPAGLVAQGANGSVRGTVTDPDTAIIPGAEITLTPASGAPVVGKSGSDGSYRVSAPAGVYTMTVTMPGFATFSKVNLKITAGQAVALDAKLIVGDQTTVITVTSDAVAVGVDTDSNAAATVIKGKDLEALSDDPDELSSELSALAGPAAGPNGGQIYVDGFTGGQLPPKSSIREIRINQNPFSAQFDRLGFGRVEVFTKPGTDKFHGSMSVQGNDNALNTSNPFLGAGGTQPPYYTFFLLGNITGPLTKFSSFSVGGSRRTIQNNVIVDPTGFYSTSATSATPCDPGPYPVGSTCANFAFPNSARAVFQPQLRQDITPRLDFAIGPKNVLTVRYQYEGGNTQNSGNGGNSLPSTFNNNSNNEQEIQISDTQTVSPSIVNETRFEYQRGTSKSTALSAAPTVSVQGNFTSGGAGTQNASSVSTHIEVQNYTSIALAKNFMRFGGRLRTTSESSTNIPNANGSFTYNFLLAPSGNCSAATTTPGLAGYVSSYQCGTASQFRFTNVLKPTVQARSTDLGVYFEDDWKIRPNLTLSAGVRFEAQNTVSTHDFAPRLSIAYGIPRSGGKAPITVLRVGFGMFYDRFDLSNFLTVQQYAANGPAQQQYTVVNPVAACRPGVANPLAVCGGATLAKTTSYTLNPNLRAPYTMQAAIGLDQQLGRIGTVSINYLPSRGNHEYLTRLTPTTTQYQYDFQSTGVFRENQLFINTNIRTKRVTMFGFYALNFAKTNTSGSGFIPTSSNPAVDYGRAGFANRHQAVAGASYTAPYKISLSPFTIFRSGSPYNITTGLDNNGDNVYNDRPAFASGNSASCAAASSFQQSPAAGYSEIPINYCTGPSIFTFNLRAARTFGFGPKLADANAAAGGQGGQGGRGGPGGGRGGPGGGRGGGGGGPMGGFGGGGGTSTGRRYNLTLGAQAQNLFNVVPYAPPTATSALTSTQFGKLTQLVGRPFSTPNAVRLIQLQATFNF